MGLNRREAGDKHEICLCENREIREVMSLQSEQGRSEERKAEMPNWEGFNDKLTNRDRVEGRFRGHNN